MAITVKEALDLDILKGFKVIAGKKGLSKEITHVAVWDYETGDLIEQNFSRGDFALSTLVAIKDNIDQLYEIVERMIKVGISCLAVKDIYIKEIPGEVIKLADKEHFPIMMFNGTFTEDVIVYVNLAISEKKQYEDLASQIDSILYNNLNELRIKQIALKININFKDKNIVAFCKRKSNKLSGIKSPFNKEMEQVFSEIIPYEDGYLFINTFEEGEEQDVTKTVLRRLKWCGFDEKTYIIGVSGLYEGLGNLDKSIHESLYAYKHSACYRKDISFFHEIGINKIILPLLDNPWVLKYYDEMIWPLIDYDKNHETELLITAVKYVEHNGDIKAVAEELFQHGNTIRYRIDKINKILFNAYKSEHFYEELAMAVRIYTLLNNSL
ncbi:PucR family transcriptional regulator ligand-binding domain-containing protein [Clostridium swellfunianum]|uniref:PucR family transcriptional regulator n=1 Tax=Clostridium swellfunianum TaxID=1367462 RepID=UPI00202F5435|nr:PucR family transcriptional regulator [Clostridium swellfunianum]MCM0650673.1 PucR family transcriptional regulator ligand-binding domain-containing protein [Clostridium swellfunianum]